MQPATSPDGARRSHPNGSPGPRAGFSSRIHESRSRARGGGVSDPDTRMMKRATSSKSEGAISCSWRFFLIPFSGMLYFSYQFSVISYQLTNSMSTEN